MTGNQTSYGENPINLPHTTGEYPCLILDFKQDRYIRIGQKNDTPLHIWRDHCMLIHAMHGQFGKNATRPEEHINGKGKVTVDLELKVLSFAPECHRFGEPDEKKTLQALKRLSMDGYDINFAGGDRLNKIISTARRKNSNLGHYQRTVYERLAKIAPITTEEFVQRAKKLSFFHHYIQVDTKSWPEQQAADEIQFRNTIESLIKKKLIFRTKEKSPRLYIKGSEQKMLF